MTYTRAVLQELAAASPADGRLRVLVPILEALGKLEGRGQAPASSRLLAALVGPLPVRACAVLELAQGLGLVVSQPPGACGASLVLWSLTEAGRAVAREGASNRDRTRT